MEISEGADEMGKHLVLNLVTSCFLPLLPSSYFFVAGSVSHSFISYTSLFLLFKRQLCILPPLSSWTCEEMLGFCHPV